MPVFLPMNQEAGGSETRATVASHLEKQAHFMNKSFSNKI
jgi:hypothetical protein